MHVFVTGATGFVGSAVTRELIDAGHSVLGLTRSEAGAEALRAVGAEPLVGTIENNELLKRGAEIADGVIHLAFNHDFTRYVQNCEDDSRVIATLGSALADSHRPLIVTSGAGTIGDRPRFRLSRFSSEALTEGEFQQRRLTRADLFSSPVRPRRSMNRLAHARTLHETIALMHMGNGEVRHDDWTEA